MPKIHLDEAKLPFASLTELNAALRQKQISSVELTEFFGKRLEKAGPSYNALALSLLHEGKKTAKDADSELKVERYRGLLQGIPYAVKDLLAVAKFPTTWGAKPYADQVFEEDATVIRKLANRKAPLIGKLSMVELAGGGGYKSASASLHGPGLNPWNRQFWSGGSSSGSGAAVSAGLVPFALGSETSGSILTPASYCGVSGLRPTYGLVSRYGAMALSWTLDKIGVFAHSAEDCGHVLHVIAGSDDNDPGSAGKSFYYTPEFYPITKDLRIGYAEIDFSDWPDEELRPPLREALAVVKTVGASMVETKLPDYPYGPVITCIIDSEAASIFEKSIKSGQVDQLADQGQIEGLKAAMNYSALDYLKAMRIRAQIRQSFRELFASVDLLVAPTKLSAPDRADQPFPEDNPKRPDQKGVVAGLVQASNLAGLPALTIPCGFVNGLPVGLQIVGRPFSENHILEAARQFQSRTNFHQQHPNVEMA
jgi:aspartyl-tRNA(Asn)/glutamyl-tRNA(Gln) amidotransferase subunit A